MCALVMNFLTVSDCRVWLKYERGGLERNKDKVDVGLVSRHLLAALPSH